MFFYIGESCNLLNKVDEGLFLDEGWTFIVLSDKKIWYKGYSTDCRLSESIPQILQGYQPRGIWCVISEGKIYHSVLRGFEVYHVNKDLTNLKLVEKSPSQYRINYISQQNTLTEVVEKTFEILVENFKNFISLNDVEFNIWVTGGVDTTLLITLSEHLQIPYNLYVSTYSHQTIEGKTINEYNSSLVDFCRKTYWGYKTLSVFNRKTCIVTGFYGDTMFCRDINQLRVLANSEGKTLADVLTQKDYLYNFVITKYNETVSNYFEYVSESDAKNMIMCSGRNQIWHIDNTLTFCPYYDERLLQIVSTLPVPDLIKFGANATIQKELIKKLNMEMLSLIDDEKNSASNRINFFINQNRVQLKHCKSLIRL